MAGDRVERVTKMVEMLDYKLHAAVLATEDRVRETRRVADVRGPVRVHRLRPAHMPRRTR